MDSYLFFQVTDKSNQIDYMCSSVNESMYKTLLIKKIQSLFSPFYLVFFSLSFRRNRFRESINFSSYRDGIEPRNQW